MSGQTSIHCGNCGAALEQPPAGVVGVYCPVCQLFNDLSESVPALAFTTDSLGASLGALLAEARAGGLSDDDIVRVLRDELEFVAELSRAGRQMLVQIIDLGPSEQGLSARPVATRALRSRVVGR